MTHIKSQKVKTIEDVVKQGLCIACGTCSGVCPKSCINMTYDDDKGMPIPRINFGNCTTCGVCFKVCPGISVDFKKLNLFKFNKESHTLIGNYIACYVGHATSQEIRQKASSGGLITALTSFALENEIVDGALVTKLDSQNQAYPVIMRKNDNVLSAAGSKYCPVPANLLLKEALEKQGKNILVGLPCHIAGLSKAQLLNSRLSQQISYCFGLVCNHTPTFHATEYLLRRFKIERAQVQKIAYRGNGWPGGITITLKNGANLFVPQFSPYSWGFVFERFFWANRCLVCEDKLCELADISFMDAWLPELVDSKSGLSLIIVRSRKGEALVKHAVERGVIKLTMISPDKILQSQSMSKVAKRIGPRKNVARLFLHLPLVSNKFNFSSGFVNNLLDSVSALWFMMINKTCTGRSSIHIFFIEYYLTIWRLLVLLKHSVKP